MVCSLPGTGDVPYLLETKKKPILASFHKIKKGDYQSRPFYIPISNKRLI
jgi:hypothetical protein